MGEVRKSDFFGFDIIIADKILFLERRNRIFMAKISVIISDEMKRDLDERASAEERNISWIVRKAIEEYLNSNR